jgi:hypothetical protein
MKNSVGERIPRTEYTLSSDLPFKTLSFTRDTPFMAKNRTQLSYFSFLTSYIGRRSEANQGQNSQKAAEPENCIHS